MQNTAQQKQKRRSPRDSVERVDSFLKGRDFVAVTQIAEELNLQVPSIKKCIETLQRFNRVEVASNGNIVLVKSKVLSEVQK